MISAMLVFVETFVIAVNMLFMFIGVGLIYNGLWAYLSPATFADFYSIMIYRRFPFDFGNDQLLYIDEASADIYVFLTVTGILIISVSYFGMAGPTRKNPFRLYFYLSLLACILVTAIAFVYLIWINQNYRTASDKSFKNSSIGAFILRAYGAKNDIQTALLNAVMLTFRCCGITGYEDFNETRWKTDHRRQKIPAACCVFTNSTDSPPRVLTLPEETKCMETPDSHNSYYKTGCYDIVSKWYGDNPFKVWTYPFVFFGIILLMIILGLILLCYRYRYWAKPSMMNANPSKLKNMLNDDSKHITLPRLSNLLCKRKICFCKTDVLKIELSLNKNHSRPQLSISSQPPLNVEVEGKTLIAAPMLGDGNPLSKNTLAICSQSNRVRPIGFI